MEGLEGGPNFSMEGRQEVRIGLWPSMSREDPYSLYLAPTACPYSLKDEGETLAYAIYEQ